MPNPGILLQDFNHGKEQQQVNYKTFTPVMESPNRFNPLITFIYFLFVKVGAVLDVMGEASAKAQGLKQPITSGKKIKGHPQKLNFLCI